MLDIPKAYLDLAKEAAAGKLAPGPRKLGLGGGYVELVLNEKHAALTDEIKGGVASDRNAAANPSATAEAGAAWVSLSKSSCVLADGSPCGAAAYRSRIPPSSLIHPMTSLPIS